MSAANLFAARGVPPGNPASGLAVVGAGRGVGVSRLRGRRPLAANDWLKQLAQPPGTALTANPFHRPHLARGGAL